MLLKNAARREYRLKDGTLVPGVTTVIDVLSKPALLQWAWKGGYECGSGEVGGVTSTFGEWQKTQRDSTAGVGTISHYKIQCWLNKEREEYGPGWEEEHIKMADVPFNRFMNYYDLRSHGLILSEHSSVHERHRYGGTLDLLVETTRGLELWDIKTSKAIYEENYIQLAAYKMLLQQHREWRSRKIRARVVLVTKDGHLEAPDVSDAYMAKAKATWAYLIKMYHRLHEFRKAA